MPDRAAGPLLLDTHVWIWAMSGETDRLGAGALRVMEEASGRGEVLVSAISVWEVAMLEVKGRVRFSIEVGEWVRRALAAPGVRRVDLLPEIAVDAARLPGDAHGDPADRLLVATARRTGATLLTCDARILRYAGDGHLAALDASR